MERVAETGKQHEPSHASSGHGRDASPSASSLPPALQLQQLAGNQAMQEFLRSGYIQAKLAISNPDDPEEREADNVAHTIMRKPAGAPCSCSPGEEMCEECQQKQSQPTINRRASAPSAPAHVPRIVSDVLRSPGHPLDAATRAFFEPRFGRDFSSVRVHTGPAAASSARSINANAYTLGPDIVFASGHYSPDTTSGRSLLAHELAHVVQDGTSQNSKTRLQEKVDGEGSRSFASDQSVPDSPRILRQTTEQGGQAGSPVDAQSVKTAVDVILQALKGITTKGDSAKILQQFQGKSAPFMNAILQELKSRAGQYDETSEGMVRWLFNDMTAEDRRDLRTLLMKNHVLFDLGPILVSELTNALGGVLDSSQDVMGILTQLAGADLDAILSQLEPSTKKSDYATALYLFGEIDRVSADKLRTHFIEHGNQRAWHYVAYFTASKIHKLVSGFLGLVSHSESTMVVNNFEALGSPALCQLTQQELDKLTRVSEGVQADERLFKKLDASDYDKLQTLPGLTLRNFPRVTSVIDTVGSGAKWVLMVAEWTTCGVIGIATGLLAAVWDLLKGIWDIVVAVKHLIGCLVYVLSLFTVGSEDWLAVKDFFLGLGHVFKDPKSAWDQLWGQLKSEFQTIEGPFADCKRAEFVVRKFVGVVVNILLIALAGYGLVKAGVSAVVEFGELAEEVGFIRALGQTIGKAGRAIMKFVPAKAGEVAKVLKALMRPVETLMKIRKQLNGILLAVDNEGVYAVLRKRASGLLENERTFWKEKKEAWQNRGLKSQAKQIEIEGQAGSVQNALDNEQVPDNGTTAVEDIDNQAQSLNSETDALEDEMKSDPSSAHKENPDVDPATAEQIRKDDLTKLMDALRDPESVHVPLDPADADLYDAEMNLEGHKYQRSRATGDWCKESKRTCGIHLPEINGKVNEALVEHRPKVPPDPTLTDPGKNLEDRVNFLVENDKRLGEKGLGPKQKEWLSDLEEKLKKGKLSPKDRKQALERIRAWEETLDAALREEFREAFQQFFNKYMKDQLGKEGQVPIDRVQKIGTARGAEAELTARALRGDTGKYSFTSHTKAGPSIQIDDFDYGRGIPREIKDYTTLDFPHLPETERDFRIHDLVDQMERGAEFARDYGFRFVEWEVPPDLLDDFTAQVYSKLPPELRARVRLAP